MARKQHRSVKTKSRVGKARHAKPQVLPQPATPPKPSLFAASVAKLQPLLNGTTLSSVRESRLDALAKKSELARKDVAAIVEAHKVAADTGIAPELLFALSKMGVALDKSELPPIVWTGFLRK